jgi:hypothetical protein
MSEYPPEVACPGIFGWYGVAVAQAASPAAKARTAAIAADLFDI